MLQIVKGLNDLIEGRSINAEMAKFIMREIMNGKAHDVQVGAFLTALRMRGEHPEIVGAAASVMREFAIKISPSDPEFLVDTCGTGGDNKGTFNISTIAGIVASASGAKVAKHGNRSVSSKCGSADLLEGFGARVDLDPKAVEEIIDRVGFGFMFAPKFHPAMKYAMPARKALGIRTIFNILGPLTNPASAKNQVLGVYSSDLLDTMVKALQYLGAGHVYVVFSEPGVDEIVPISKIHIAELSADGVERYILEPRDLGLPHVELSDVKGGDLETNLKIAASILQHKDESIKEKIVAVNAAYALMAAGVESNFDNAFKRAENAIVSGAALKKLEEYVRATGGDLDKFAEVTAK